MDRTKVVSQEWGEVDERNGQELDNEGLCGIFLSLSSGELFHVKFPWNIITVSFAQRCNPSSYRSAWHIDWMNTWSECSEWGYVSHSDLITTSSPWICTAFSVSHNPFPPISIVKKHVLLRSAVSVLLLQWGGVSLCGHLCSWEQCRWLPFLELLLGFGIW